MCGLYGTFRRVDVANLAGCVARLRLLRHRGPDGWGSATGSLTSGSFDVWTGAPPPRASADWFLGHHRLRIVGGGADGHQPIGDADAGLVLVFNGEIYNHQELRRELAASGHRFRTADSDSEVLLRALVEWGDAALHRIHGMFAFAVLDMRARRLFFARDRLGQKPLYYRHDQRGLCLASGIEPLLDDGERLDRVALGQYLALGYVPAPRTIVDGIHKVPPATACSFDLESGALSTHRYWALPPPCSRVPHRAQTDDQLRDMLAESVRSRARADVPVGLLLSGGIDSTCVAKFLPRGGGRPVAYTAGIEDPRYDETPWAKAASRRYGLDLRVCPMSRELFDHRHRIMDAFDEPFGGLSAVPMYALLHRASADGIKVMLTGDGADELFLGYPRYLEPRGHGGQPHGGSAPDGAPPHPAHPLSDYIARRAGFDLVALMCDPPPPDSLVDFVEPHAQHWGEAGPRGRAYVELKTSLPGRMLTKLDRIAMAFGVEGRSPFMDHRLVELAYRQRCTPDDEFGPLKPVLKRLLVEDLGEDFVRRAKLGFGHPLRSWFGTALRKPLLEPLRDAGSEVYRVLDFDRVQRRFPSIMGEYRPRSVRKLWRLLVLARFCERLG